ncbi:MAG: autotransporter outer membrane beta-barrel domain-containing protein, partial [Proteobacteria bacterium]|nr:autotransporter outer membrane beta-barrel domain-containing protein [Pseudomonadota bacterium]
ADGSSDLLAITGTTTLDGALDITGLDGPIALGTSYTILSATGGISGSFSSVTQSLVTAPLALPVLTIGANSVTFEINVASFTIAPLNLNQTGVALALDQFSNDGVGGIAGDYINDLAGSPLASIGGLLDPLVSEAAADFPSVIFAGRSAFLKTVGEAASHRIEEGRWSLWASAYGVFGSTDASLTASGYEHRYAGLVAGAMFGIGTNLRAGLTLGLSDSDLDVDAQPGKNRHESVDVALHAGWTFDALEITTVAALSFEDFDTSRIITSPSVLATARGDANGTGFSGLIKASYRVERPGFTFLPTANFEIINFKRDAYEEAGAGNLGLSVAQGDLTSARLELGGTVSVGSWKRDVGLYAGAFWSHEFADRERDIFATFLADPTASFLFSGVRADKDAVRATAGFGIEVGARGHLGIAYDGLFGARQQTHSITARFIINW